MEIMKSQQRNRVTIENNCKNKIYASVLYNNVKQVSTNNNWIFV